MLSEKHRSDLLAALDATGFNTEGDVYVYDVKDVEILRSAVSAMLDNDEEGQVVAGAETDLVLELSHLIEEGNCGPRTRAALSRARNALASLVPVYQIHSMRHSMTNTWEDVPKEFFDRAHSTQRRVVNVENRNALSTGICFFCGEPMSGKHEVDCPQATPKSMTDEQI